MSIKTRSNVSGTRRQNCAGLLATGVLLLLVSGEIMADTFSDLFDNVSYSNQDGTNSWTGNWVETNDDGSPNGGDIRINGGELRLKDNDRIITRVVDLAAYVSATLTFDYRETGFDNNGDGVFVEIRSGGVGAWTQIVLFQGPAVGTGSYSYVIDAANLAANTELRFRTGNNLGNNDQLFIDNLIINALTVVGAGDFADFFGVTSYSNQDGSLNWFSDWVETNDDGSPNGGDIRITGNQLMLKDNDRIITREIDLSGYASATLTFDYQEFGFDNNGDGVFVEIRSGGVGPWTQIVLFQGPAVGSGSYSYPIAAANLLANTEVRFRTGANLGNNDRLFIDNFIINVIPSAVLVIDHFDINLVSGTFGINCVPHQIRVTAHDSGHNPFATYVGEIQLVTDTGAGDWSDGGLGNTNAVVNGGGGSATYQFDAADLGEADFYLDYTTGAGNVVGIGISDTASPMVVDDSVETIQFSPTGFTLTSNLLPNPPPNPINDPVPTQEAGTSFFVYLAAYGQTPTDADCGVIEAYTGNHELHFWVSYDNPGTGTLTPTVDGQAALDQECVVPGVPLCDDPANKQVVAFVAGQANVSVKYKDVGSIDLNVKDDDFEATQALTIRGDTGNFVVQPSEFTITTIETLASVANPGTTTAGSGFVAAGESFHVVVQVKDAEGSLVPNYGNEDPLPGETIRILPANLIYPAGGSAGLINPASTFTATAAPGEFESNNVFWDEVGTLTLRAGVGDSDYLSTGDVTGSESGNVGRFYPQDFELASAIISDSCTAGGFSYMSQPAININYTLNARNLSSNVVTNYDNAALTYNVALPSYHAENNNDGVDRTGRFTIASGQWSSGVLAFTSNLARFARIATPDGPYNSLQLGLQISEPDGADFVSRDFKPADSNDCVLDGDCVGVAIGTPLNLRFGRMQLKDGFGPELAAIPMFWQNEYWDGSSFVLNSDDHCTQLAIGDVTFGGASTSINAGADTITVTVGGISSDFNFADPIGASDCMTALNISFCDGQAGVAYGAPGAVVTYPIGVDLTNLPYLQFDWNQDGNYNDAAHPPVNINFQSYRGNDRVIYWQETFQ